MNVHKKEQLDMELGKKYLFIIKPIEDTSL